MRRGVGIGLSVVLCLTLANEASSGAFETPFAEQICADIDAVESMGDPSTVFIGAGSSQACEKLCNKAASQCRGYAKDGASCLRRWASQMHGYSTKNCDVIHDDDPGQKQECKQNAKGTLQFQKGLIQQFLDQASEDCEEWGTSCASFCPPL